MNSYFLFYQQHNVVAASCVEVVNNSRLHTVRNFVFKRRGAAVVDKMLSTIAPCDRRRILFHMDINRTIIQVDAAGGKSIDDVLNTNIAGRTFGRVNNEGKFELSVAPDEEAPEEMLAGLIPFDTFVDKSLPPPEGMEQLSAEERRRVWKGISEQRRSILRTFTHAGNAGAPYAHLLEAQRAALSYPSCNSLDGGNGKEWRIIPSFFQLVNTLSQLEWPFSLVFRTFGNDMDAIAQEWHHFVQGSHSVKPLGPVLEQMKSRETPPCCGALYRNERGLAVAWGRHIAVPPPPAGYDSSQGSPLEYLQTVEKEAHAVSYNQLYQEIEGRCWESGNVLGLVDYYYYWSQNAEHKTAGKVFPILTSCDAPIQIFFDDNISIGEAKSIVDIRCAESGEPIDVHDEEKYCCCVQPLLAILDKDYFVKETMRRVEKQFRGAPGN